MAGETSLSDVRFLTIAEVALIMRVSKMTVYRLVHTGELEAIRVGRSFRVPEAAVSEYLRDPSYTPVRIYLAVGENPGQVESAVLWLLEAYGFRVERQEVPVIGSWYRKFWVQAKNSAPPATELLAQVQHMIELRELGHPVPGIDLNQADAVTRLLGALSPEADALIQIGPLVLIKVQNKVFVRTLTQPELSYFNHNPALFQDPARALQALQQGKPGRASGAVDG